jgi:hypothetical protein
LEGVFKHFYKILAKWKDSSKIKQHTDFFRSPPARNKSVAICVLIPYHAQQVLSTLSQDFCKNTDGADNADLRGKINIKPVLIRAIRKNPCSKEDI